MSAKNGYFQLVLKSDGNYLKVYPPMNGGQILAVNEVAEYLTYKSISFDIVKINKLILSAEESEIKINEDKLYAEQEMMKLTLTDASMKVIARFYPPYTGGSLMSKDEIMRELASNKVNVGIKEDVIDEFVKNREYCRDYVIAEGQKAVEGHDAKIEYLFDFNLDTKPLQKDDGTVDFFNLNTVCHCKKGQLLARLIKEDIGAPGKTVLGDIIKPKDVQRLKLQFGRNITLSEDRTMITSDIDGHVLLIDDKVFVSGVLELANVDTSTGNINYEGNVLVNGNVMTGFSIHCSGDIEVRGVVEGAKLEAGGQIILARGINGMSRGELRAGTNIIAKYIENALAFANGYVQTDCILHSRVSARTKVIVKGKRGFITGGVVRAGSLIEAKTLGSTMGVDTVLEVGTDPELRERFSMLQKDVAEIKKSIATTEPVIMAVGQRLSRGEKLPPDQIQKMKIVSQNLIAQKEKLKEETIEMTQLSLQFDQDTNAFVRVTGEAHPGTRIVISESSLVLKTQYHYCRFVRDGGDIVMAAL